jgi:site-specific recombinase XerD
MKRALTAVIGRYLDHLVHRGLAVGTVVRMRQTLTDLQHRLERRRVRSVHQVRPSHLAGWVVWMKTATRPARGDRRRRTRYAASTVCGQIRQVRMFFRWLTARGVLLADPARDLTTRGLVLDPMAHRTIPTERQMGELLDRLPQESWPQLRDGVIFELMYSSALRASEIRALDVYDVDLTESMVRVRSGKGGKDRLVPVGRKARVALATWLDVVRPQMAASSREMALFVTKAGRRLGPATLRGRIAALRRRIPGSIPSPHGFRHACAVHFLRGGADLRHVQELLGHARVSTTAIYTRLVPTDLKEAHRRCHPRERATRPEPAR